MKKKLKGGIETIITIVIIVGLVLALLLGVVRDMSNSGEELIDKTTNKMVEHQTNIRPDV